jgi:phosphoribosylpyrophosphate synthetase
MIGSGGTVHELITKLSDEKGIEEVYLGASHNLCMESARQRLLELHERHNLREVVVTDSIPQTAGFTAMPFLAVRSLSDIVAKVINRIHLNQPVGDGR